MSSSDSERARFVGFALKTRVERLTSCIRFGSRDYVSLTIIFAKAEIIFSAFRRRTFRSFAQDDTHIPALSLYTKKHVISFSYTVGPATMAMGEVPTE